MSEHQFPEPMRHPVFAILLALAEGPRHGYGLMQRLGSDPLSSWSPGPATLYRTLRDMEGDGLIAAADGPSEESGGPPRRYYALTRLGRARGQAEAERMAALVARWAVSHGP